MQRRGILWSITIVLITASASAAVNSWTSQVTGAWHDLSWSLGVRPDISQDAIMVTNYGQKAVIIDSTTVNSYLSTLTISNLNVAGTPLSTNTLLLNFTGTAHPLHVYNSINVNPNGVLLNLSGAISLEGTANTLTINGAVINQDGGSNYFSGNCYIGTRTNYGSYNLTNGILCMGNAFVDFGGVFNQIDGTTSIASFFETSQSYSSLVGGSGPRCTVLHGAFSTPSMLISGDGSFYQGDATITVSNVLTVGELLSRFTDSTGSYYLTNGTLTTGSAMIGEAADGYFFQYGGIHRTSALNLDGNPTYGSGGYELDGGNLICAVDETLDVGSDFTQNGGTNSIGGQLTLHDAFYSFNGGLLGSWNVFVQGDGAYGQGFWPVFTQSNGNHYVTNTLAVGSFATYDLYSGALVAGAIELNTTFGPPGFLNHTGGMLSSSAMTFSGGQLTASGTEMLGTLTLAGSTSSDYLSSNSVQHFAASAQISWESNAVLQIYGWLAGTNHIYVGNSASALTERQLQQITFPDVGGWGKLLATGELVPWPVPPLVFTQSGTTLTFSWPGTAVLQWADDPAGPYTDVPGASSPYTPPITAPQKFFRLRQS